MPSKKGQSGGGKGALDLLDKNEEKEKLEPPSKYKIIYWNNDVTPMQLVTLSLIEIYGYPKRRAEELMIGIHESGRAVVKDNLPKQIAETKRDKTLGFFQMFGYPLKCTIEKQ
jgi:ATP-dependent Clp protease adaptor protein ClpS